MKVISKHDLGNLKGAIYQDSNGYYLYKIRGNINGKSTVIHISYTYFYTKEDALKKLKEDLEVMALQKEIFSMPYV